MSVEELRQLEAQEQALETEAGLNYCHECLRTLNLRTDAYSTCYQCGAHFCEDCSRCACDS